MEVITIKALDEDRSKIEALKAVMKALNINFELSKEVPYDPEFVAKIEKSREQARNRETVKIALDDIWK